MSDSNRMLLVISSEGILYQCMIKCLGIELMVGFFELEQCREDRGKLVEHKGSAGNPLEIALTLYDL